MKSLVLFLLAVTSAAGAASPNVLLICIDDMKPLTHSYGDAFAQTPQIDRLAARGVQFDRAYCNQAVCGPSRYNLMLGSRSTSTGIYNFGRDFRTSYPQAVTLPQFFKQHGYTAAAIGKVYHVGHGSYDDAASWSVPSIKDKVIEYLLPESTSGGKLTREEHYFGNIKTVTPHFQLSRGSAWECVDVPDDAYADGRVATEAVRRLAEYRLTGEKFFLAVGFARPHLPFTAPQKYWDLYDPAKLPLAANPNPPRGAPAYALKQIGELNQYAQIPEKPPVDAALQRRLIHGYYAGVSYVDAQIGRVLAELERSGLAQNTIVVLWGDNGFSFGTHGDWTKHSNYEEANRIPVIFAGPGVASGARTPAMFETVDIYPTLAALAGLPAPQGPQPIDGASQAAALTDPTHARVKEFVYHAFPRARPGKGGEWLGRAIRTERYRYVEWRPFGRGGEKPEIELYDYTADPLESENVASKNPDLCAKFQQVLDQQPATVAPLPASHNP